MSWPFVSRRRFEFISYVADVNQAMVADAQRLADMWRTRALELQTRVMAAEAELRRVQRRRPVDHNGEIPL